MELNANLKRIFNLRHKYSDYTNAIIEDFWNNRPNIPASTFNGMSNARDVSVQSIGYCNGVLGTWDTSMSIDENQQISKLKLTFSPETSSRSKYFDTFSLSLSGIAPNTPFWSTSQNLIDFTQKRVYNYRMLDIDHPITASEIKKLSQPVTIARFTLTAKKNASNNSYTTFGNETFGFDWQPGFVSSETPEEIEA